MIKNSMRKVLDWLCLTETGKVILFFVLFLLMFLCGCAKTNSDSVLTEQINTCIIYRLY